MTTQADPKLPAGSNFCLCTVCRQYFNSVRAFEAHRTGDHRENDRRCFSVAEMQAKGMALSKKGYWVTEKKPETANSRLRCAARTDDLPKQQP